MQRCKRCLMPDTKPGVVIEDGICRACRNSEYKRTIDYKKRWKELEALCDKYRRKDNYYEVLMAASGGKDSHFQTYVFKEKLGMKVLLCKGNDPYTRTKVGDHNLRNLQERFKCDLISAQPNQATVRQMTRIAFEEMGMPNWPTDRLIYTFPIRMAIAMKIPLLVYGENVSWEYGGVQKEETYSARDQINNDVARKVDWDLWRKNGIKDEELVLFEYPSEEEIDKSGIEMIFLSYFVPWNAEENYRLAQKLGFRDLTGEWCRKGHVEPYDQIDSVGYLFHAWMKWPKFGFSRVTDTVGWWIRAGLMDTKTAARLVKEKDHELDPNILRDFLDYTGYSEKEFWAIVEKFWNRDIFEKKDGSWELKQKASVDHALEESLV